MDVTNKTDLSPESSESHTFGVVNVNEIHKNPDIIDKEHREKEILKKWLIYSLFAVVILILLGVLNKYFWFLTPLPPIISLFVWKVKRFAEKVEEKNPI